MTETTTARSEQQTATANLLPIDRSIPLVVDLDGTLLLTDTLHESFLATVFRSFGTGLVGALKGSAQPRSGKTLPERSPRDRRRCPACAR